MNIIVLNRIRFLRAVFLLLAVIVLSSCGGGGGASNSSPNTPDSGPLVSAIIFNGGHYLTPIDVNGKPVDFSNGDKNYYFGTKDGSLTTVASSSIGIASVQFLVDGQYVTTATDPQNIKFPIITSAYTQGPHTFTVRAYDVNGKYTDVSAKAVVVNQGPTSSNAYPAEIVTPTDGSNLTAVGITVSTNIEDPYMYTVELLIDGKYAGYFPAYTVAPDVSFSTQNWPSGTHKITVICTDKGLNSITVNATYSW